MTNKTKTMVGIVAALGVAATLGTYAWLSENDTKPVAKQDAVSKPVPPPTRFSYPSLPSAASAEGRAPGCTFAKGDALSYDVSLSASVTVDPTRVAQAASAPAPTFQTDTRATLDLEVLEATGDSADGNGTAATLLARFRSVDTPLLTNASYLTAPFLVKVNAECAIDGFARASATKKSHGRIQQGLVHELLFHWAADPAVAARDDENSMGPFTARYAVLGDKDGTLVQRRIASYGKFWEDDFGNGRKLDVVPTDSLMSVRVGAGPWFEGLSAVDAVANGIDSVREELNVRRVKATAGALAASSHTASDYIWENLLPLNLPLDNPQPLTGRDIALQSRVANLTTEESLARLEDRIQKETGIADLWPELSAYLEAKPHAAFEVEAKLRAGEVSPEAESMVFVALGHARTEEARRVLHGIMLDSAAPAMERTRAMFSLIDREDVGVELANELHGISAAMYSGRDRNERFVGREAALAVSAMAGLKEDHE
ncbi:MAG: hypothetical protein KC417_17410, partial [Myxococcales bacterium]|nr:hypothetical protein [Myxococcales bacterium]